MEEAVIDASLGGNPASARTFVGGRMQAPSGGMGRLQKMMLESSKKDNVTLRETDYRYDIYYRDMFRMVFRPSPPIVKLVEKFMAYSSTANSENGQNQSTNLLPRAGMYTSVHYRAFYAVKKERTPLESIKSRVINALNCASNISPSNNFTFYFASDSNYAEKVASEYARQHNRSFVSRNSIPKSHHDDSFVVEPLHLEYASQGNTTYPVSAYYDTFVDFLVLGSARCVARGVGGFGVLANLISYDPNCTWEHSRKIGVHQCEWYDPKNPTKTISKPPWVRFREKYGEKPKWKQRPRQQRNGKNPTWKKQKPRQ